MIGGDPGEDVVHFCPIHMGGAFGHGGGLGRFVEMRGERVGDQVVYADVFASFGGNAIRDVNLECQDAGIIRAN